MSEAICTTLEKLVIENDDHWTSEGLPRLDVMKELGGEAVSRAQVTEAAKGFTRATPVIGAVPVEGEQTLTPSAENPATSTPAPAAVAGEGASGREIADLEANGDGDAVVIQELEDANAFMVEAQARLRAAQADMDVVITRKASETAGRTSADDIKAYQRSQQDQRAGLALTQKSMVAAAKAAAQL